MDIKNAKHWRGIPGGIQVVAEGCLVNVTEGQRDNFGNPMTVIHVIPDNDEGMKWEVFGMRTTKVIGYKKRVPRDLITEPKFYDGEPIVLTPEDFANAHHELCPHST